ncbi:MAG: hypothetical protein J6B88_04485 [Clostridia bacterium]|nr:hypothetical protein [Clostridia bacterium]
MRKFLSIVLAVMLIICIFPINDIKVNAVTETLTLNQSQTITVVEEQNTVLKFTPSKTGYYSLTSSSDNDLNCTIYNGNEEIAYNDDGGGLRDFSVKGKLQAGVTYTFEVGIYFGACYNATVILKEATYVTDIKVINKPVNLTYLKGFVDDYFSYEGLQLMLTLSNKSVVMWNCDDNFNWDMYDMRIDTSDADATGKAIIKIDDAICELPLNILNKTIKSIEVIDDNFAPLEEGAQGIYSYDEDFNEIFYYSYNYEKLSLKVNYSDGSSDTLLSVDEPLFGVYYAYTYDNQFDNEWTVGGAKNTLTVELLNATAKYNVKIVENPVKSITINTAPTRQYVYGDLNYGDYFYGEYFFYPNDLTGIKFTVNFKDGSKKAYTYNNINQNELTVDGYALNIEYDYFASPGKIPVTLSYRGCEAEYNVTLKASGVSGVEITKAPNLTKLKNDYFSADFIGAAFKITYTNGTTKTVNVTNSNSKYIYDPNFGEVGVDVSVDGNTARFYTEYDYEYGCTTTLTYMGASCIREDLVSVADNPIKDVKVTSFESNGSLTVKLILQDNTEKTLSVVPKTTTREDYGDCVETMATASTEWGVINYSFIMYENNMGFFELSLFDKFFGFKKSAQKGDFDFNGRVDLVDVVALSQYVAGWDITCSGTEMNINGDSETDLLDVVHLSQYVANWQGIEIK